jgi:hypothetical protein
VGGLVHLGYPFRCRNGGFIIEGPVNVLSAEGKRHVAPICGPASRHDHRSAGCRRSYWDGRSAISRRRLTTKSYLTIALPMRLGIKHASTLEEEFKRRSSSEEEFKQSNERSGPRSVPAKGNGSILPNAFLPPEKISLFSSYRREFAYLGLNYGPFNQPWRRVTLSGCCRSPSAIPLRE